MSIVANVEYLGFTCLEHTREYRLRVHFGAQLLGNVTVAIPNSAFAAKVVRFQDGPDVCFHKLQAVVTASSELPERIDITPGDLADYCTVRAPRASGRRSAAPRRIES